MSEHCKIILKSGKDQSVKRFHPWVFSGAITRIDGDPAEGDVVDVFDSKNEFLGRGHYATGGSIRVRILTFIDEKIDTSFWVQRIRSAFEYRKALGLTENSATNAYRLIFAEGDQLPGLIIDIYNDLAVIQAHSVGMYLQRELIAQALQEVYGKHLAGIYDKSAESIHDKQFDAKNDYLYGQASNEHFILENGHKFYIDWQEGQKTGFFLDQRENRQLLAHYAKDKEILNTFCYTGGFSIYALKAGAKLVHSVDSSKRAIDYTTRNVDLNSFDTGKHEAIVADTFDFLKGKENKYDIIVLDPPAFAKHKGARHKAVMGYKRLNAEAMKVIRPGGILFTFSCSQIVDKYIFYNTIMSAAIQIGRSVKVMHQMTQPADHPINIFHPEGEYLKGLVLKIE